jgi:hypothetical protein
MTLSKEDHRMGITPILLRRASYYIRLGEGEYEPIHPHYDKVIVDKIYDLTQNPLDKNQWGMGLRVSFYSKGRRIRWIEFGCNVVGAGGDDLLREV